MSRDLAGVRFGFGGIFSGFRYNTGVEGGRGSLMGGGGKSSCFFIIAGFTISGYVRGAGSVIISGSWGVGSAEEGSDVENGLNIDRGGGGGEDEG